MSEPYEIIAKKASKELRDKMYTWLENNPVDVYWSYDDGITTEQIDMLMRGAAWEAEDWTHDWMAGQDAWNEDEDTQIRKCIEDFFDDLLDGTDFNEDEIDVDALASELNLHSYTQINMNFNQLVQQTRVQLVLDLEIEHYTEATSYYDEAEEALDFFNINPLTMYNLINRHVDRDDEEPWIDIPERDGNEYVDPEKLLESWFNMFYHGMYVALLGGSVDLLTLSYRLEEAEEEGKCLEITLEPGTLIVEHSYWNGSGGLGCRLKREMKVRLVKENQLSRDGAFPYGVQDVHGFVSEVWENSFQFKVVDEVVNEYAR